jgi:hypothetical protein
MIQELTSPESKLMLQYLKNTFNPSAIERFIYEGTFNLSPAFSYDANILYFAIDLNATWNTGNLSTSPAAFELYDNLNVVKARYKNNSIAFDTVSSNMNYSINDIYLKNVWFSRFSGFNNVAFVKIIGYKLTIP